MNERRKAIILTYAECNMNVRETARRMNYSWNAIYYQLQQIREKTGLDPCVFYDLVKLLGCINEVESMED